MEEQGSIEFGWSSPLWMARALIWNAEPALLRLAVNDILNLLWASDEVDADEIFERIVQICATGKYVPVEITQQQYEETMKLADEMLQKSEDEEVEKFRQEMDDFLGGDEDDE